MEPISFGYWLRLNRKALDLTREGLAGRVGCSAATIRKLEDEERRPSSQIAARLMEIFGIPASERANFSRFTHGDWLSAPVRPAENLPWRAAQTAARTNLPASLTELIGREQELAFIRGYLADPSIRLVTLIGPPGIGKTRLATESARVSLEHFPHGVFFIALASLEDPSLIVPAILQVLGVVEAKNRAANQQLLNVIGKKRLLLLLDNCEHLVGETAALAVELLAFCSGLTILVTSSESLRIPGEWLFVVPPLGVPPSGTLLQAASQFPSLTLFAERARAVRPDFAITQENINTLVSICDRMDGLPLAIELIASRMGLVSPQSLLERLEDTSVLIANGRRAVSARHKTLGDAFDWTYRCLSPEEQKMFALLSVFTGGFSLDTVEAAFADIFTVHSIPGLVTSLVEKSMLQRKVNAHGGVRFTMLVTIRQFAVEQLRRLGLEDLSRNHHLAYFLDFAETGSIQMRGPEQVDWSEHLEIELDNFRSSLDWSVSSRQTASALRLLAALGWPWEVHGHYSEGRFWLKQISTAPDLNAHPLLYARVLNHIGRHCWTQERIQEARTLLEQSRAITEKLGQDGELVLADALNWLGLVRMLSDNDPLDARAMFEHSLLLNQKWADQHGVALSTFHLGISESLMSHVEAALPLLEKALSLFRQFGDLFFIARTSLFIGYIYLGQKDFTKAHYFLEEHLRIDTQIQFWDGIAEGWRDMGNLFRHQGQMERASQNYGTCIDVCNEHGLINPTYITSVELLALYLDNYDLALERFNQLLDQIQKVGTSALLGVLLLGMAAVASGKGQPNRAALLWGAGYAFIQQNNIEGLEVELAELDRHIHFARIKLSESEFAVWSTKGRSMTPELALTVIHQNDEICFLG